jgi:hypothetical protein
VEALGAEALPVAVRGLADFARRRGGQSRKRRRQEATVVPALPPSGWSLVLAVSFTSDAAQRLQVLAFQVRDGERLERSGLIIDRAVLSSSEWALVDACAEAGDLDVLEAPAFIDEVFLPLLFGMGGTCVGMHLPPILARLARRFDVAHSGAMRDGFTFQLSEDPRAPWAQIRHLSATEALIRFTVPRRQRTPRGMRRRGLRVGAFRGFFLDIETAAAALLEFRGDLTGLGQLLGTMTRRRAAEPSTGGLDESVLTRVLTDAQVIWECSLALQERYKTFGLDEPLARIYSGASLGKALWGQLGVRPLRVQARQLPMELSGHLMAAYSGGRSEVGERRVLRESRYCDFRSQFATVAVWMHLIDFVRAQGIAWHDSTVATRSLLAAVTPTDLHDPSAWYGLATLVELEADDELLPVRAKYDRATWTIGLNYFSTPGQTVWYPLADVLVAKFNGHRTPTIRTAITFTAGPVQGDLHAIDLLGDPRYPLDPAVDDPFRHLVELRAALKRERDACAASDPSRAALLDAQQAALKILISALSYGIYVELNVSSIARPVELLVYGLGPEPFATTARSAVERPGRFFAPLLGCLIAGGARLMLGLAERLLVDEGLGWAFVDTDGLAITRPNGMAREAFEGATGRVRGWFDALNPYRDGEPLLRLEDANYALDPDGRLTDRLAPLYCFAVSDKRYALFNLDDAGRPIIRKASAHGLGHLVAPYQEHEAPLSIPDPHPSLAAAGLERWQHDVWYRILEAALDGHPDQVAVRDLPGFDRPAVSRYATTTPTLLGWFDRYNRDRPERERVGPFVELAAFQARKVPIASTERIVEPGRRRPAFDGLSVPGVVGPFDPDPAVSAAGAFDRATGVPIPFDRLATYAQSLAQYHLHPEAKFANGDYLDRGRTHRRHVRPVGPIVVIGKEANRWEEQLHLGVDPEAQIVYGAAAADLNWYRASLAVRAQAFSVRKLERTSGLPIGTAHAVWHGHAWPSEAILRRADGGLAKLEAPRPSSDPAESG